MSSAAPAAYAPSAPTSPAPALATTQPPTTTRRGLFPDVVTSLANRSTQPSQMALQGQSAYEKAVQDKLKFEQSAIDTRKNIYDAPTSARVMQGRDAAIQQANAETRAALQQAVMEQQQAIGFGQTQQSIEQSGLGTAAGLAQPQVAAYGQTVFDPITGQYGGGQGNLDPQTQAPSLAQRVLSGQMTYDQAVASMAYAGNAGRTFLDNALTQAGGNPLQLQASGAATQSNIQQAGTAGTDIARGGLEAATRDYVAMTTASQFAHQQASAVTDILAKTGLNDISSTDYNKSIENNLRRRFSDTDFAALDTALREAQIAYTNLLSSGGGTPTGNEDNALATLNINQSASAINASIQQLENAVARRLQALSAQQQTYQQNLGSGQTGGSYSGGGSSLYDF